MKIQISRYVKSFLEYLNKPARDINFKLNIERINITDTFSQSFIYTEENELKIDFVNDLAVRFDNILNDKHFGK